MNWGFISKQEKSGAVDRLGWGTREVRQEGGVHAAEYFYLLGEKKGGRVGI